jgi:hypothetical protein
LELERPQHGHLYPISYNGWSIQSPLRCPLLIVVSEPFVCVVRKGRYEVDGYVYSKDEEPKLLVTGKWNTSMSYQPCDEEGEPLPGTDLKEVFPSLSGLLLCTGCITNAVGEQGIPKLNGPEFTSILFYIPAALGCHGIWINMHAL